jgi:Tfp pilus assembly protein PilF
MKRFSVFPALLLFFLAAAALFFTGPGFSSSSTADDKFSPKPKGFTGSQSCRECHEKFYQLWAPSHHGLAMQPYSAEFAQKELRPQEKPIVIGKVGYRAVLDSGKGYVLEQGPQGKKTYKIAHVLGGKNVYYFLTPLDRGRLQTLPVSYDVRKKEWFDTAASGVRHFPGRRPDEPVNWKDWQYTFNTACYSCHVSQLSTNYTLKTDTYKTTWTEPGINCETCHGPADEHLRVCRAAPKGTVPQDLKIIRGGRSFTVEQNNAACASCHAKSTPLTKTYALGERFFDHYDLLTLENPDYYSDGRDLGENYTYTTWIMSPCVKSGKLSCLHCHTSSGRFRQKKDPNQACLPCHQARVEKAAEHTRHPQGSPGSQCIACHMPMTEFARMQRSDHSMLPPAPAATQAFKSPNACNGCHKDKDAAWADRTVRQWRTRDYQKPILHRAGLVEAARKRDWSRLPEMLSYITAPDRDEVFAASLIRLMPMNGDPRVIPALLQAVKDPSPLVRSASAETLGLNLTPQTVPVLLAAAGDEIRLVRVKAAAALVGYPRERLKPEEAKRLEKANEEYLAFIQARPDQWTAHYNMGNYYLNTGKFKPAIASYQTAFKKEPQAVMALVNASLAYSGTGDNRQAEKSLRQAIQIAPESGAANFNLGLLKAEQKDLKQAERYLRAAFQADPQMAQAAYNLCVLLSVDRPEEAIGFCRKASELRPEDPRYSFTLAFYLHKKGENQQAVKVLDSLLEKHPNYRDGQMLKREITGR